MQNAWWLLQLQVASADKRGQGLGEEVLAMSSQLKMLQSELESSRQVLQGRQGVIVACLEAQWLMAGEPRLSENWNHTAWDSCWSAEPLPPHLTYDVPPYDLSIINHSPQLSQLHNPLGFCSASACSILILTNELKFCCKHSESGPCSYGLLLCMLVMLLDWNLGFSRNARDVRFN